MVLLDDEILASAHLSEEELLLELAIVLYQQRRLTQRQAARLARISTESFEIELAARQISNPFDETDLAQDLETLKFIRAQSDRNQ